MYGSTEHVKGTGRPRARRQKGARTSGGIAPLPEGGMTTRSSGLRLLAARLPLPGGGGDFVGMTLPRLFAPVVPSKFGEALEFTNPFPGGKKKYHSITWEKSLKRLGMNMKQVFPSVGFKRIL